MCIGMATHLDRKSTCTVIERRIWLYCLVHTWLTSHSLTNQEKLFVTSTSWALPVTAVMTRAPMITATWNRAPLSHFHFFSLPKSRLRFIMRSLVLSLTLISAMTTVIIVIAIMSISRSASTSMREISVGKQYFSVKSWFFTCRNIRASFLPTYTSSSRNDFCRRPFFCDDFCRDLYRRLFAVYRAPRSLAPFASALPLSVALSRHALSHVCSGEQRILEFCNFRDLKNIF